jgi:uncharacterized damage-inducible protein DinB
VTEASAFERTDPPYAADDATMLRSFLDYYRATILRQADGLTDEQRAATLGPSTLTLGGIVKHLTLVENWWFRMVLNDLPDLAWVGDAFDDDPDWEFSSAKDDSWELLVTRFRDVVAECDELLDRALATPEGLDLKAKVPRHGKHATVRWILVHMVEEYARHAGHADLIRESIDGRTDL